MAIAAAGGWTWREARGDGPDRAARPSALAPLRGRRARRRGARRGVGPVPAHGRRARSCRRVDRSARARSCGRRSTTASGRSRSGSVAARRRTAAPGSCAPSARRSTTAGSISTAWIRGSPTSTLRIACDVTNPLLGERGAAATYGPQKGASPSQVAQARCRAREVRRRTSRRRPAGTSARRPAPARRAARRSACSRSATASARCASSRASRWSWTRPACAPSSRARTSS